ncbi:MAG: hypothetical protein VYB08_16505, partial [Candidatus Latescibacterota bacterium]|nr:hypothetical protein [Candidatus Latescibacterota bacterium]
STGDPYFTLSLYHSRHIRPTGTFAEYAWRWGNPASDAVVERTSRTAPEEPALRAQFREAMDFWLGSCLRFLWCSGSTGSPTYWRGWSSADDPTSTRPTGIERGASYC